MDIRHDLLAAVAAELKAMAPADSKQRVWSHTVDVTAVENVQYLCKTINKEVFPEHVSILINNAGESVVIACGAGFRGGLMVWRMRCDAGIVIGKDILSLKPAEIQRTFEVNIMSHFSFVQGFLPEMASNIDRSVIVTMASVMGMLGTQTFMQPILFSLHSEQILATDTAGSTL